MGNGPNGLLLPIVQLLQLLLAVRGYLPRTVIIHGDYGHYDESESSISQFNRATGGVMGFATFLNQNESNIVLLPKETNKNSGTMPD